MLKEDYSLHPRPLFKINKNNKSKKRDSIAVLQAFYSYIWPSTATESKI